MPLSRAPYPHAPCAQGRVASAPRAASHGQPARTALRMLSARSLRPVSEHSLQRLSRGCLFPWAIIPHGISMCLLKLTGLSYHVPCWRSVCKSWSLLVQAHGMSKAA